MNQVVKQVENLDEIERNLKKEIIRVLREISKQVEESHCISSIFPFVFLVEMFLVF